MFGYWSVGAVYARQQDILRGIKTLSHNYVPFIVCEGKCSEHRETFTTHKMLSELYSKDEQAYEQTYGCTICKHQRRFGLTVERQTLLGEGN